MEWLKWMSGLAYALFIDTNKFAARLITDAGTLELTDADSVNASNTDSELKPTFVDLIKRSEFAEYDDQSNALFSTGLGGGLTKVTFTSSGLATGIYTLRFMGDTNSVIGAAYDVTFNTVPLPGATLLFFTAVLGFTAISARHSL